MLSRQKSAIIAGFASLILATPSRAEKLDKQTQALFAMTPADFAKSVDVKDDSLEPIAVLSTINGWQKKEGILKRVNNDFFVRAFVNKTSGEARYQVYSRLSYAQDWLFFQTANYLAPEGLRSKDLTIISRDVLGCFSASGGCLLSESTGFDLSEEDVRWVAAKFDANNHTPWQFRLKSKGGVDATGNMMPAEFAGIVAAVDNYRQSRGLRR